MISLQSLADFVAESPEARTRLLKNAISEGTNYPILDTKRLLGLEYLNSVFGEGSHEIKAIVDSSKKNTSVKLPYVAEFVKDNPEKNSILLKQLIEAGDHNFHYDRLPGIARLNEIYGDGSPTVQALIAKSRKVSAVDMRALAEYIDEKPDTRKAQIEEMVRRNSPDTHFWKYRLRGLDSLNEIYGADSPTLKRLMQLEKALILVAFVTWHNLSKRHQRRKISRPEAAESAVSMSDLRTYRLEELEKSFSLFGKNSPSANKVLEIANFHAHSVLDEIEQFLQGNPDNGKSFVEKLLTRDDVRALQLSKEWLAAAQQVSKHFDSDSDVGKALFGVKDASLLKSINESMGKKPQAARRFLEDTLKSSGTLET